MCPARNARRLPRRGPGPRGRHATAPARPLNNEGRHDQSPDDPSGSSTERMSKEADTDRPDDAGRPPHRSDGGTRRRVPPDDRQTTILPAVVDDRSPRRSHPIDEVKAALGGSSATPRDPLEEVKAALDGRAAAASRRDRPLSGRPPEGPP